MSLYLYVKLSITGRIIGMYSDDFGFSGFNSMFTIVPIIVVIGFVLVFALIITQILRGANQWKKNNNSPVLVVEAKIVAKRSSVRNHHQGVGDNMHHSSYTTTDYVTFEVASGDRMELVVGSSDYGLLVENDFGSLTFQGTRYLGFERYRS